MIDKGIYIKNIYCMLAYAFQELKQGHYDSIASTEFDNVYELLAEILIRGVSYQLKQGLHKEYIPKHEALMTVRGRINISDTLRDKLKRNNSITCDYDDLSESCMFNRVIKTTMEFLLRNPELKNVRQKTSIKKLLLFFSQVQTVDMSQVKWSQFRFDRNTRTYQMMLYVCYFIFEGVLLTDESGNYRMPTFKDDKMCRLFEKFILEYYRKEHPQTKAWAKQISWDVDKERSNMDMLPVLQTDVYLTLGERTLIIDAKYYSKTTQTRFEKKTIHSHNLYQILAYVNNEDANQENRGLVDGMLLYAKTDEAIVPDGRMTMKTGNVISFKTLDLGVDFDEIKKQLDGFITKYI